MLNHQENLQKAIKLSDESVNNGSSPFGCVIVDAQGNVIGEGYNHVVLDNDVIWSESPYLHEAGTQNYLGVMALVASMQVLKKIGFDEIEEH